MIIDKTSLERFLFILMKQYVSDSHIVIDKVDITLDQIISIKVHLYYYHIEMNIDVTGHIEMKNDIYIKTSGTIQYGMFQLDSHRILQNYLKDVAWCQVENQTIIIKNEYLKDIRIHNHCLELELLEF